MSKNIYSIFDTVAQVFNKPFTETNNATAIRSFTASAEKEIHKNDFVLYNLGEFNETDGKIKVNENPIKIFSGFDVPNQTHQEMGEIPNALKRQAE